MTLSDHDIIFRMLQNPSRRDSLNCQRVVGDLKYLIEAKDESLIHD